MSERVQDAIRRARGTWAILEAHPRDAGPLLNAGWEPYGAGPNRVYLRRRERDWSAAVVLVVAALAALVVARWLILLLLAWLVVE